MNYIARFSPDAAIKKIPANSLIHAMRFDGDYHIGYDMAREEVINLLKQHKAYRSGPTMREMGHGLMIIDNDGPLFIQTDEIFKLPEVHPQVKQPDKSSNGDMMTFDDVRAYFGGISRNTLKGMMDRNEIGHCQKKIAGRWYFSRSEHVEPAYQRLIIGDDKPQKRGRKSA